VLSEYHFNIFFSSEIGEKKFQEILSEDVHPSGPELRQQWIEGFQYTYARLIKEWNQRIRQKQTPAF